MRHLVLLFCLLLLGCEEDGAPIDPLQFALASDAPEIQNVMNNLEAHEVQIKLSTISIINDSVHFEDFEFQVNDSLYFYPASTVKWPVSILAIEKLKEDSLYDLDSPFFVEGDSIFTTFRKEIRDIFAVSSNESYNRLFEFLGKDYINSKLADKEFRPLRISHRLSTSDADELTTRPLIFKEGDSTLVTTEPIFNSPIVPLQIKKIEKGIGFFESDELVMEPKDFSEKNYLPISTLHDMMKRLIFPQLYAPDQRFKLTNDERLFIIDAMALLPKELGYDTEDYYDSYGKYFIYGDTKVPMPSTIKIHNKVGYAYGYLTDSAYIVDMKNDVQFILTATIHVNENGIFNDDIYEYDSIGIPFLAQLGREIHSYLISNKNY